MEKAISTVAIILLFATIICIAYISPSQKVEYAKGKVLDAKKEVKEAKQDRIVIHRDFLPEYKQFSFADFTETNKKVWKLIK